MQKVVKHATNSKQRSMLVTSHLCYTVVTLSHFHYRIMIIGSVPCGMSAYTTSTLEIKFAELYKKTRFMSASRGERAKIIK